MQIFIKTLSGKTKTLVLEPSDTVFAIRNKLDEFDNRITYASKDLVDEKTLEDYKLEDGSTLEVLGRIYGGKGRGGGRNRVSPKQQKINKSKNKVKKIDREFNSSFNRLRRAHLLSSSAALAATLALTGPTGIMVRKNCAAKLREKNLQTSLLLGTRYKEPTAYSIDRCYKKKMKQIKKEYADLRKKIAVVLYEHGNYTGNAVHFKSGNYARIHKVRGHFGGLMKNDRVSSLKVNYGFKVIFYKDSRFRGAQRVFFNVEKNKEPKGFNNLGGFNDQMTSMKVIKMSNNEIVKLQGEAADNKPGVTLYQHGSFRGYSATYRAGNYPSISSAVSMDGRRVRNDDISSLKVYPGYKVTFYKHGNFRGGSNSWMSNRPGHIEHVRGIGRWNDQMSSMKVEKIPMLGKKCAKSYGGKDNPKYVCEIDKPVCRGYIANKRWGNCEEWKAPSRCKTCKSGDGQTMHSDGTLTEASGGVKLENGVCKAWCSTSNYCGVGKEYKDGGTDCRPPGYNPVVIANNKVNKLRSTGVVQNIVKDNIPTSDVVINKEKVEETPLKDGGKEFTYKLDRGTSLNNMDPKEIKKTLNTLKPKFASELNVPMDRLELELVQKNKTTGYVGTQPKKSVQKAPVPIPAPAPKPPKTEYSGPHYSKYLPGWAGGKPKKYRTLDKAKKECDKMGKKCGGITLEPPRMRGFGRLSPPSYGLRAGTNLGRSGTGERSWIKKMVDGFIGKVKGESFIGNNLYENYDDAVKVTVRNRDKTSDEMDVETKKEIKVLEDSYKQRMDNAEKDKANAIEARNKLSAEYDDLDNRYNTYKNNQDSINKNNKAESDKIQTQMNNVLGEIKDKINTYNNEKTEIRKAYVNNLLSLNSKADSSIQNINNKTGVIKHYKKYMYYLTVLLKITILTIILFLIYFGVNKVTDNKYKYTLIGLISFIFVLFAVLNLKNV